MTASASLGSAASPTSITPPDLGLNAANNGPAGNVEATASAPMNALAEIHKALPKLDAITPLVKRVTQAA